MKNENIGRKPQVASHYSMKNKPPPSYSDVCLTQLHQSWQPCGESLGACTSVLPVKQDYQPSGTLGTLIIMQLFAQQPALVPDNTQFVSNIPHLLCGHQTEYVMLCCFEYFPAFIEIFSAPTQSRSVNLLFISDSNGMRAHE